MGRSLSHGEVSLSWGGLSLMGRSLSHTRTRSLALSLSLSLSLSLPLSLPHSHTANHTHEYELVLTVVLKHPALLVRALHPRVAVWIYHSNIRRSRRVWGLPELLQV
jgi:hypothetical protein